MTSLNNLKEKLRLEAKVVLQTQPVAIQLTAAQQIKLKAWFLETEHKNPTEFHGFCQIQATVLRTPSTIPLLGKIIDWWHRDELTVSQLTFKVLMFSELAADPSSLSSKQLLKLAKVLAKIKQEILSSKPGVIARWFGWKNVKLAQLQALESQVSQRPSNQESSDEGEQGESEGEVTMSGGGADFSSVNEDEEQEQQELDDDLRFEETNSLVRFFPLQPLLLPKMLVILAPQLVLTKVFSEWHNLNQQAADCKLIPHQQPMPKLNLKPELEALMPNEPSMVSKLISVAREQKELGLATTPQSAKFPAVVLMIYPEFIIKKDRTKQPSKEQQVKKPLPVLLSRPQRKPAPKISITTINVFAEGHRLSRRVPKPNTKRATPNLTPNPS